PRDLKEAFRREWISSRHTPIARAWNATGEEGALPPAERDGLAPPAFLWALDGDCPGAHGRGMRTLCTCLMSVAPGTSTARPIRRTGFGRSTPSPSAAKRAESTRTPARRCRPRPLADPRHGRRPVRSRLVAQRVAHATTTLRAPKE